MIVTMPQLHARQREILNHPARFKVWAAGRRGGKTRGGGAKCVSIGASGGRAWWIAPSYPVSMVGWRLIKRLSQQIPGVEVRQGDKQILYPSGGEVRVRSADNPDSLRGEGLDYVVFDECAFIKESAWYEAIRPALSDRQGGALFISTPRGRNWFWRLYQLGMSGDSDEWKSWQLPTSDNPFIDPAEIEAARLGMPELTFEQEYLAQFLESEGAVFRNIVNCINAPTSTPEQHDGHTIVGGIDWGKSGDYTAISVGCLECRQELALDRYNKIDYHFQRKRIGILFSKWRLSYALCETNAMGEPNLEMLRRSGLPVQGFTTTSTSKPQLIENLALALEREELQFLGIPLATAELEAYERQTSPKTGRSQYSAPSGMHDDTVIARALMMRAITSYRPAMI